MMTSMKSNNVIFFHVALMGHGENIANEMLDLILSCDIYNDIDKIYVGVVGGTLNWTDDKVHYLYQNWPVETFEFRTLNLLQEYSKENPNDKVLYLNTLGATSQNPSVKECKDNWRKYATYFLVENHKKCLGLLDEYDTCAPELIHDPVTHYSGNMWWTTSEYASRLCKPEEVNSPLTLRHKCEFWIGTGEGNHCSIYNSGTSPYERHLNHFPRSKYVEE